MKQPTNGEVAVAMENQTKTPNQPKDSDLFFQKNWTKRERGLCLQNETFLTIICFWEKHIPCRIGWNSDLNSTLQKEYTGKNLDLALVGNKLYSVAKSQVLNNTGY